MSTSSEQRSVFSRSRQVYGTGRSEIRTGPVAAPAAPPPPSPPTNDPKRRLLTTHQVALRLGVADRTVRKWAATKILRGIKVRSVWRFDPLDIERFIARCMEETDKD